MGRSEEEPWFKYEEPMLGLKKKQTKIKEGKGSLLVEKRDIPSKIYHFALFKWLYVLFIFIFFNIFHFIIFRTCFELENENENGKYELNL